MGHNAFFVREDVKCSVPEVSLASAWREAKHRESKDEKGNWTFLSHRQGLELIANETVVDTTDGKQKKIKDFDIRY